MIKRRSVLTRKTSCPVCSKKRIKCDRLVPCTNCLNKGLENECLTSTFSRSTVESTIESHILSLYQNWDHWIVKEACFNGMLCMMHVPFINENNLLDDSLIRLVDEDNSFKILDFAMSNLGFMFFGYFADITEFYLLLEKYWEPKKYHGLSLDDMFTETLLWSIFSMSVYYMNQRELENLFGDEDLEKIYKCFLYYTLELIKNILHIPDVRIIQAFLILSNTDFRYRYPMYYHHLFCTVQHISSTINLNNIKPFSFENSFLSYKLIKDSCDKMWFQLLYWDYLTESIKRPINLHYNFKSLVLQEQQDVFPKNIENVENNPELYKVEETFELLLWKFVSLDRDMEQYVNKKASMKSIDAIEKEIILLDTKRKIYIKNLSSNSKNDLFQKFMLNLLINFTFWKLYKLTLVYYYDDLTIFDQICHYSKKILKVIVLQNNDDVQFFKKYPMVLCIVVHIGVFHAFLSLLNDSKENYQLYLDVKELLTTNMTRVWNYEKTNISIKLMERFVKLKGLVDAKNILSSPAIKILKQDVDIIKHAEENKIPNILSTVGSIIPRKNILLSRKEQEREDEELSINEILLINEENYILELLTPFKDFI